MANPSPHQGPICKRQHPQGGRVVFNIKGNDYRVVTVVAYKQQAMFVKFVGTHKQYDAINAQTVELSE